LGVIANCFEPEFDADNERPGFTFRRAKLGWQSGAEKLGVSLYEIAPGEATFPTTPTPPMRRC
jgi:uncharacterized cupin superfamily protein